MLLPKQKESEVVGNVYSDYATRLLQERDQALVLVCALEAESKGLASHRRRHARSR